MSIAILSLERTVVMLVIRHRGLVKDDIGQ